MIDVLKQQVKEYKGNHNDKYNFLREQLQILILKKIDEAGYFKNIAFVGGTALRILYDLKRFSEDLDFSLINATTFDFTQFIEKLRYELHLESLVIEHKSKMRDAVCMAQLKFKDLLFETQLSPHKDEVIMIKLEVDCRPPAGYKTELTLVNKGDLVAINHFDLPSLFAGKLHAILQRKYTKGRDYYDFLWYMARKIKPNFLMLNQALEQTMGVNPNLDEHTLIHVLEKRFDETNYALVRKDVEVFLSDPKEIRFFTKEIFMLSSK
ncbi:MAG: nucleotidyl transferase AbiEii/AbiGii toxin family protein [Gammaproteobacteria bacterium]|nr:nucleotidyl transferase AbiEii/AbiGii toxin family protein [Gammaproteobacteria bacterium]